MIEQGEIEPAVPVAGDNLNRSMYNKNYYYDIGGDITGKGSIV